ncbi:hypothetical protein TWF225_001526 [Orbilia oligospora]|nr:hypothetical protein TWF225_001526 [Orbilia oligospora]KAF3267858.1 hypothetical protein TWF217_011587 [Orbilia oligospora]KAF3269581.1 hypothetical protein TWF128_005784 [Orbilia oligospora]
MDILFLNGVVAICGTNELSLNTVVTDTEHYNYYKKGGVIDQLAIFDEGNVAPEKISRYKNQSKWSRDTKERQAENRRTKSNDAKGEIIRRRSPSDSGQREMCPIKPELEEGVEEYLQELEDLSV